MDDPRIACHVLMPSPENLPPEDGHAFWDGLDALAEAVAADDLRTLLLQSSDAPPWAAYFWIPLPRAQPAVWATLIPLVLNHLSRLQTTLPQAEWKVSVFEKPCTWDGNRFLSAATDPGDR